MHKSQARVLLPNRGQMEFRASDLDSVLAEGHRARLVWAYVERQDLSRFYQGIRAVKGGVGRSAIAPEILLALWLYATLDCVGSAREITRLSQEHDAYRWLCGGVQVNYHSVADFRTAHGAALDELLSDSIASLMAAGVVKLKQVAQDGIRVRASAGSGSFRRKPKLEGYLDAARAHVARLKVELEADPAAAKRAQDSARMRAANERQARLEKALARLPELEAIKQRRGQALETARASMTDADATIMKMGDGGFRPAYNPQLASDTDSLVILGVTVSTSGSDQEQMVPMIQHVTERCQRAPEAWLVDGGYVSRAQIDQASATTCVYGPVPERPNAKVDPHRAKPNDNAAVAAWRERMGTPEAKARYTKRAATAECVNAQSRNRGLQQFKVRGLKKVTCVMLLFALAHNLMRTVSLAPELIGLGIASSGLPGIGV